MGLTQHGSGYIPKRGFTIYGYDGTAAETYAKENGFTFISLGDAHAEPSTDAPAKVICGDADGDNDVTIMDATSIQRHIADLPTNQNIGKSV